MANKTIKKKKVKKKAKARAKARWSGGTLVEFVDFHGSQRAAALVIGFREETLNRILNGHETPRGMTVQRLKQLRIDPTEGLTKKG